MKFIFAVICTVYFALLFSIGLFFKRKYSSQASDLLLANRSLNFWVTALSAHASDMSAWLFMAFPMSVYFGGMPQAWIILSLVAGMYASWTLIAPRLRHETELLGCMTVTSFFEKKFNDASGRLRVIAGALAVLFLTYYLSAGMISVGFLAESIFQLPYVTGLFFAVLVVMGYTFIGGFLSVAWVDLFQALFLLGTIITIPLIALYHLGGTSVIFEAAQRQHISMNLFQVSSYQEVLLPLFGWGLGYLGMPHIITKFMAIDKTKNLRKSMYVGISWQILSLLASLGTGLVSIAFFQNGIENAELVFVELAQTLVNPVVAAAALCGILAATISTMDSQILVASTFAAEDLLHKLKWTKAIGRQTLFRIAVVLISAAAFTIALSRNATIMDTVYYAWAGLGASFAPLVLGALFFKRIPAPYAIAGLLSGGLLSAIWPTCNAYLFSIDLLPVIPSLIPGFGINMLILTVGSFSKQSI